ncbi:extracellular catalytic domain type 1 short-chain-length polyhydroxyalkanoate depolymerase [Cupriavidus consociatus]|uniref:extracellular catalytic domain type 1 short-chain-length polyhydroxyalkanoate depolymerase n=1 Tax=Cupriavidus consociatus TaxID=2821357 RepID=UPI001AE11790|nr:MULTISPECIES: PHB depolymerase family esterase [unclassified Cupriavidus]MBP0619667.1 prolyl oligopeptidase family serine peptidase [Cupriavidus sp. LEh25]MDK2656318.1 PHB depolymerase family esterase [Cupriavidus sp. LEh21]
MTKSLAADWHAQLRRLSRVQARTETQVKSWLQRLDSLNPLTPSRSQDAPARPRRSAVAPLTTHATPLARSPARSPAISPIAPDELPGIWQAHRLRLAALPGELVPQLSYHLYIPSKRHRGPLPVVVLLHGCRQTPDAISAGTRMNALAEQEGFIVAYPQQPLRRQVQRCWQWFDLSAAEGGREAQALAALLDALAARHDVREREIYLAGMSAGAAMAAVVALRYPGKVAAVAMHSGVVIGAADTPHAGLHAMRHGATAEPAWLLDAAGVTPGGPEMPALVIHGLADDAVHPVNGRLLARQFLAYNELEDRLAAIPDAAPDAAPGEEPGRCREYRFGRWSRDLVALVEVEGLDHAWSGGDASYGFHSDIGPDASAMMWDFLRQHRR